MPLLGIPLIQHSVQLASNTGLFEHIAVSSDSVDILDCASASGADILVQRPQRLASDTAAKLPAIQHCLLDAERQAATSFDEIVDLDSTSPLRIHDDIKAVLDILSGDGVSNVITGAPARRSPYFNLVECGDDGTPRLSKSLGTEIVRRQDAPACYDMNASIYAWKRPALIEMASLFGPATKLYVMPEERSVDIDSPLDFSIVEMLMREKGKQE